LNQHPKKWLNVKEIARVSIPARSVCTIKLAREQLSPLFRSFRTFRRQPKRVPPSLHIHQHTQAENVETIAQSEMANLNTVISQYQTSEADTERQAEETSHYAELIRCKLERNRI